MNMSSMDMSSMNMSNMTMPNMNVTPMMGGPYGGSNDPCILGYTNGTYPNGSLGKGNWKPFGVYMPTSAEKAPCQNANDPWAKSMYYGHWTTYFILAVVAAVSISNAVKRLHNLNRITGIPSVLQFHPKISAFCRMLSYPQLRLWRGSIPPLGPSILLFGFFLFSTLVCFLRRPFYRPPNYGSSPLGLRSEWVATAMVPWIYAAATKRNFLEFFTGVSFQRIMTLHKWAPWICLYMSIVHTWAMIIRANRQEPWSYTLRTNPVYWNGFPPLVALAWLCVMSLGQIRNRFYETFYIFHIIAAVVFLVWMYIHLADSLKSWQYMHAATVLWGAAILWRLLAHAFDHGWFREIPRASFEQLPAGAFLIRIPVSTNRTWGAGSYVYLRFLTVKPWESHPFTISSLPVFGGMDENDKAQISRSHEMVFVVRPYNGITARLAHLASASPDPRACLVDGPFGGFMDSLRACDAVVLIAGGTGMSVIAPIAQAFSHSSAEVGMARCHSYRVHWAIRDSIATEWFKQTLNEVLSIDLYITGSGEAKLAGDDNLDTGGDAQEYNHNRSTPNFHMGRPNLDQIIRDAVDSCYGRIGVVVCGPTSMLLDTRNSVAAIQGRILMSDSKIRCSEIEFYEESYGM